MSSRLANRTRELDFFKKMVLGEVSQRILLIEAQSGYGKTGLMERFLMECPENAKPIDIDLKDAMETGILYVFRRSRKLLGKDILRDLIALWRGFSRVRQTLRSRAIEFKGMAIRSKLCCKM